MANFLGTLFCASKYCDCCGKDAMSNTSRMMFPIGHAIKFLIEDPIVIVDDPSHVNLS
jgi:hypothetical protein